MNEELEGLFETLENEYLCRKQYKLLEDYINGLQQENQELKKQLEYLRSGEYLNQLKFERNMLEDIVQNMEVSKEDKEFIDMTHRNTELLEENNRLKEELRIYKEHPFISKFYKEQNNWNELKSWLKQRADSNGDFTIIRLFIAGVLSKMEEIETGIKQEPVNLKIVKIGEENEL